MRSCRSVRDRRIDTVFFGGGTPSLFQPEDFSRLLGAAARSDRIRATMPKSPWRPTRGPSSAADSQGYPRRRNQSRVVGRADLRAAGAAGLGTHSLGGRHAPRGGGTARGETRQFQSRFDVRPAATNAWRKRSTMCASPARSSLRTFPITSSRSSRAPCFIRGRRRCPTRMPRGDPMRGSAHAGRLRLCRNTKCRHTRAMARAAGTTSITGCSAIMWGSVPARTASSARSCPQRILRTVKPKQPREYQSNSSRAPDSRAKAGIHRRRGFAV